MFTEKDYNLITARIIRCAIEVHKELGPGLMESVYEVCLKRVLQLAGLQVISRVVVPIYYNNEKLDKDFIIDLLVEEKVIVELKSVEVILPVHEAQLVTYLKLSGKKLGLLINFNVPLLNISVLLSQSLKLFSPCSLYPCISVFFPKPPLIHKIPLASNIFARAIAALPS